jgi:[protein-PII] uridylyltransferase
MTPELDPEMIAALESAASTSRPRAALAPILAEILSNGRAKAAQRLVQGAGGVEVARLYAKAADRMVQALWWVATEKLFPAPNPTDAERLALVAVGGYGRGVLAPHSDLDLMFLRPWKSTSRTEQVTEFVLYVLWDLGLKIGSSARSIDEALSVGKSDMTVRTALLEARPLAGDADLAGTFLTRFRQQVARADSRPFIAAKLAEREARHQKVGAVRYRVEPNVKDGKGGLRDLNCLFWIARGLAPDSPLGEAALEDLLTRRERRLFAEAFDFLWQVRIHMHRIADRPVEALTFDLQPEVARRMGWRGRGDEPAVERFMRRYFLVARDVGALTRAMSAQLEAREQKKAGGLVRGLSRLWSGRSRPLETPGFVIDRGRLSVTGPGVFDEDPIRLLTLFVEADRLDLDLHPDAFAAVTRSLPRVTPRLRRDPEASRAFLKVLAHGQRPYRVLSIMNETGLLGRFLPEWSRIVGQTQFNMYHAYTVDEHTLQAVGIINDIKRGKLKADHPLASDMIHRITDPEVLMLAMLLHDVGKGGDRGQLEDGAIAARRACERLGVDSRRIELVTWLVRHHLALSDYAQKRDVTDPDTVQACADLVGDPERLRMLLVLTAADIRAVGPGVWNNWKGQLLRDLYGRVLALFKGETVDEPDPLSTYPELVARAREAGAAADVLVDWARDPATERQSRAPGRATTRVAVAGQDRPGLFAALALSLSRAGADIVGARVVTAPDGLALDVFEVQDGAGLPYGQAEPRRLERLVRSLEAAARAVPEGTPDVPEEETILPAVSARRAAFDVRPVVMIDTTAVSQAVVIEVSGADRPGLLAELASAIAAEGLSLRSAHVASFGERAVDAFYVTDAAGRKPTRRSKLDRLARTLEAVLDRARLPDPSPGQRPITPVRASVRDVSDLGRLSDQSPAAAGRTASRSRPGPAKTGGRTRRD